MPISLRNLRTDSGFKCSKRQRCQGTMNPEANSSTTFVVSFAANTLYASAVFFIFIQLVLQSNLKNQISAMSFNQPMARYPVSNSVALFSAGK